MAQMVKTIHPQCGRPGFNRWVGNTPWGREWQPTPVFLSGESHGQEPGGLEKEGIYVYLELIHIDVQQKPTQQYKTIILRL